MIISKRIWRWQIWKFMDDGYCIWWVSWIRPLAVKNTSITRTLIEFNQAHPPRCYIGER
ncbi:MAG TPA: hypothetical protein VFX37_10595 [Pseudolabrys sp.]|nr:hypothetical protein [Pseudolabrys sp.]